MKLFVYKCIIVFFLLIVGFQLTFNYVKKEVARKIDEISSKENIDTLKQSLRNQMKDALQKEDLIKKEDAELINKFLDKINKELKQNN